MRMITILAAAAATLTFTVAANAQAPATQPSAQAPATAPEGQAAPTTIQSVKIVDMTELPEATQKQVNAVVAQAGDADLQQLRSTIDANPKIKSALEAKGLTSAQVIAASMSSEGALTLVTKKAG
ncbi:hypothetical protein [Mesorhizobium sp. IMUNJ 23232]|uniref:hypothetical protein n=1 Tax=Mesorhizobium sp. IMUNJ 23232 TaxID=3376064 RepID=UPI0037976C18